MFARLVAHASSALNTSNKWLGCQPTEDDVDTCLGICPLQLPNTSGALPQLWITRQPTVGRSQHCLPAPEHISIFACLDLWTEGGSKPCLLTGMPCGWHQDRVSLASGQRQPCRKWQCAVNVQGLRVQNWALTQHLHSELSTATPEVRTGTWLTTCPVVTAVTALDFRFPKALRAQTGNVSRQTNHQRQPDRH